MKHLLRSRAAHALSVSAVVMFVLGLAPSAALAAIAMQLPFPVGETWQANGPHPHNGTSGTRNSVDFGRTDNTTGTVAAVAAGTVSRVVNCGGGYEIRVDHADGWQSGYYHLASASVGNGSKVSMGQKIGTTGQGCGPATFKHVHFSLRRNGSDVNIDRLNIGGHTLRAKSYNYGGYWVRNSDGVRVAEDSGGNARCCLKSLAVKNNDPRGHYDSAGSPEAGKVSVRGWAFDPNAKKTALNVHTYIGGKAGAGGTNLGSRTANKRRADVGNAFPGVGDYHGFNETFTTGKRGKQELCVYAINIGAGSNKLLGCKTVQVADPNPRGNYEAVDSPEGGTVRVRGWTFDPNAKTAPLNIHTYIGGKAGAGGQNLGSRKADARRPDVNRVYPGVGDYHGFNATYTTVKRGKQPICVYAINIGPGSNKFLGCKTAEIAAPPPAPPPAAPPAPGPVVAPVAPDADPPEAGGARPRITQARLVRRVIRPGGNARQRRAVLRFQSSRRARVRLTVRKPRAGVRRGKRCVERTRARSKGRRCALPIVRLSRTAEQGVNRIVLTARIEGERLRRGLYRLRLVARSGRRVSSAHRFALGVGRPAG